MADNTVLDSGTGGDTIATDDIGGVKYPRSKIVIGADGSNDGDVSITNPMPVGGRAAADAALAGNPIPIAARASAAAPTDMSADNDTTIPWVLRNGSFVVNCAVGGTLVTSSAGLPITGTGSAGTAATGVMTVQGIASMTPVQVSQATASNLNATVVGTGTFVVQATCTNGGTFAVQVDGNALTALQLIDNIVHVDDAAFTLGTSSGVMVMGFAGTQSVDANDACALACSTAGALFVTVASGGIASGGIASGAIASGAVASGAFASGAIGSGAVASGAVASGAFASGALAAGSIATGAIADMLVDDAAFTPATSRVMPVGFQADESSTDSVNEGDVGCPRMTLDRKILANIQPHTAGGLSIFRSIDIDESEEEIKGSAGVVYTIAAFNRTAAPLYLKFYNLTAGNCTVGTSTPVLTFLVPGNGDSDGAGFILNNPLGFGFDTAISVACTTAVADADTGAPGANDCIVNVGYF